MWFFEDVAIDVLRIGKSTYTLEQDDIIDFASKWDPWPFHTDVEAAKASIQGELTASGLHLLGITCRLLHDLDEKPEVMAGLSWEYQLPKPGCVGDVFHVECQSLEKRESKTRQDRGIVHELTQLKNQDGDVVVEMKSTLMVAKRPT